MTTIKKPYVCVWMGCNKNQCFCIDVVNEKDIDEMVTKLGGDPKEELFEKNINANEEEHEKLVGIFMEPNTPKGIDYKIYKIKPYDFPLKNENCNCMENYGETVYFIKKGKYSPPSGGCRTATVEEIVSWVQAEQI